MIPQPLPPRQHYDHMPYEADISMRSPSPDFLDDGALGLEFPVSPPLDEVEAWHRPRSSWSFTKRNRYHNNDLAPNSVQWREGSSDLEVPDANWRSGAAKFGRKRKLEDDDNITDDLERSIAGDDSISTNVRKSHALKSQKGKGRATPTPSVVGSDVGPGKGKKRGWKKKGDMSALRQEAGTGTPSVAPSVVDDATPNPSAPPSPALSTTLIYELGNVPPPMKRAKRVDDQTMVKRLQGLDEAQRKVWLNIARRDVQKVYKHHLQGFQARQLQMKRTANLCTTQAKRPFYRTVKIAKESQTKAKRLMREMMVFWKKNEKEERDLRKRAEKEADNRAKELEEKREAARQARKLEFLISQTELYSHFVRDKLNSKYS